MRVSERIYWLQNKDWYTTKDDKFIIKDDAPERAKKSFELWAKANPEWVALTSLHIGI